MTAFATPFSTLDREQALALVGQLVESASPGWTSSRVVLLTAGEILFVATLLATLQPPFAITAAAYVGSGLIGAFISWRWMRSKGRRELFALRFQKLLEEFITAKLSVEAYLEQLVSLPPHHPAIFLPLFEELSCRLKWSEDRDRMEALVTELRGRLSYSA